MRGPLISVLLGIMLACSSALADDYIQLQGVIHVHSTFSSGRYTIEDLVERSRRKGVDVLILTDHDLVVMEYGLFPLRNIIKKRKERKSILKIGPEQYLEEVNRQNLRQKDVIVIPGVQSSPFYYWTGSPLKKNLVAHDYRKELLLVGLQNPEDYRQLPLLHSRYSTRYFVEFLPRSIVFLGTFILGIFIFFQKGVFRYIGGVITISGFILLLNYHPFQSSRYDPYHGDQGAAPYQEVIDYVNQRGGLTFWAHPESNYSSSGVKLGPVTLVTKHYPGVLKNSKNYTGFSAIYGDTATVIDPGMQWDQVLLEYCKGFRTKAAWGIAGSDFHEEKNGLDLDTFQTVFLVKHKTSAGITEAISSGRFYCVRKERAPGLVLERFLVRDVSTGNNATMGEELVMAQALSLEGRVSAADNGHYPVDVILIKDGNVWKTIDGQTPLVFNFMDSNNLNRKTYYRLAVKSPNNGRLLSNPIFIVNG